MTNYIALIGDIIESKQVNDRAKLQINMQDAFDHINSKYDAIIRSKFTLTLGDEFQALLKPSKKVFELLEDLEFLIPVSFRYGLGYGIMKTDFDTEISIGADGPAYWHAREAIEKIHDQNWSGKTKGYIVTKDEIFDRTFNNFILLSDTIKSEWTNLQKETFRALLSEGIYSNDFSQKDFADSLGISPSSLSKRLNNGNIKIYLHTRNTMGHLLEVFDESTN